MKIEDKLKNLILDNYKSIRAFAIEHDLPYSTVDNIFKRGVSSLGVSTAIKICNALGISTDALANGEILPKQKEAPAQCEDVAEPEAPPAPNLMPMPKFNKRIPILGTIACGQPILAVREDTEYVDIDSLISADFALYCKGDSMIDARIYDGDIVCIREQPEVENGEIAAVIIEDGCEAEATLKRVFVKNDRIILRPCNVLYDDVVLYGEEMNRVRILGSKSATTRGRRFICSHFTAI